MLHIKTVLFRDFPCSIVEMTHPKIKVADNVVELELRLEAMFLQIYI